ncbi:hypothetical protein [Halorubellus salinus]|uniref:hypothetical protein n=1 Tax=Halorubellus salinus TaxID=755309 RepID=UPI001D0632B6|nr:hypothetical protein [Halorubellus salinus]
MQPEETTDFSVLNVTKEATGDGSIAVRVVVRNDGGAGGTTTTNAKVEYDGTTYGPREAEVGVNPSSQSAATFTFALDGGANDDLDAYDVYGRVPGQDWVTAAESEWTEAN